MYVRGRQEEGGNSECHGRSIPVRIHKGVKEGEERERGRRLSPNSQACITRSEDVFMVQIRTIRPGNLLLDR